MLKVVLPGSNAARAGLRPGDVLLSIGKQRVESADDLDSALRQLPASARYWREGKQLTARLGKPPLGVVLDQRSPRAAVRAWRRESAPVSRGDNYRRLPGTRLEVEALGRLVGRSTTLLGPEASEQELERLRAGGKLKSFRLLHFATHGELNQDRPEQSALILARDRGPGGAAGRLTVSTIRGHWQLDADLVVLSACQTALGGEGGGEGLLGFAQAFLQKGARAVVLSRWKVEDTATALLMVRFYENLLGKRKELKRGMMRAKALAEAQNWLRDLPRKRAHELAARLGGGMLRGTEKEALVVVKGKGAKLPVGEKPFAHPYYWAAFVLVGDAS
jgi:CHAT domain-containing protein